MQRWLGLVPLERSCVVSEIVTVLAHGITCKSQEVSSG